MSQNGTDMAVLPNRKHSGRDFLARDANNLNALRLLAAIGVVISHCALLRAGHESAEPFASLTYFNLGDYALITFFFISGLTVSASYARSRSIADFILARALRIWPALFIVVFFTVFLIAPIFSSLSIHDYFSDAAWRTMLAKTFVLSGPVGTLPGLFESNPLPRIVNGSPWTLRFEVICYAVLVGGSLMTARLGKRARAIWMPATVIATGVIMILKPAAETATTLDHLLRFWFAFGLGSTIYQLRAFIPHPTQLSGLWVTLTGTVFLASIGHASECVAAILFTAAATLFLAGLPLPRLRAFTNRFDLSYGVYITAWPITQILVANAPGLSFGAMLAIIILLSLTLAFASWTLIERPAIASRHRLVSAIEKLSTAWRWRITALAPRNLAR